MRIRYTHTSNASMCAFFILRIVGRGIPDAPDPLYEYPMCEVKKGILKNGKKTVYL